MKKRAPWVIGVTWLCLAASQLSAPPRAEAAPPSHNSACRNGYVSISFDDGPTPTTPDLLRALRRNNITATFFDLGRQAELFPQHVQAERAAGHEIANHTYDHANFQDIGDDAALVELAKTQPILAAGTDVPEFYRPPYGATNPTIAQRAFDTLGLTEVIWTVDTNDWDGRSTADIVRTASSARAGDFVLMHDGYPNTINAIAKIADALAKKGLCAGRIARSATPTQAWENLSFNATVKAWG
ncbi:MAG: hypothetical protein QOJ00_520 [Actinomycetota bacterium]